MPAIVGLRGSGGFTTDERPKNWREKILELFPNGSAPLTAVLSLLKNEGTDDPEFNWWEKRLQTQRMQMGATAAAGATALTVVSGARDAVTGTLLLHEVSGEIIRVITAPSVDTAFPLVERSWGVVPAATLTVTTDFLTIIGNVNEEGSLPPIARAYAPTKQFNYTQIYRTSLYLTRTARRTRLRWDNQGPYREAKREALSIHSIEMEKSAIFGDKVEVTGPNGLPMRGTGGILSYLLSNKPGGLNGTPSWAVNGTISEEILDSLLENLFRYGSNERLVLAGSTWIKAITTLGKRNGTIEMVPTDTTYGMAVTRYLTPFGTLMIKNHPLFSQHPEWRKNALFIDTENVICRPLDDTMFVKNRQSNGEDASLDEYLTEIGYEWHFEETHGWMTGVTGGTAS